MVKEKKTVSFNENYAKLKSIAEMLSKQEDPDVDQLIVLIEQATTSYKNCKKRLDAVKKALDEYTPKDLKEE